MQKLTKAHLTSRDQLIEDLNDTYEALEDAVSAYNTTLAEAWNEVLSAEEAYNDATQAAQEWLNDRAAEIQASIDARSEQWQDSDRGKAYGEWKETFDLSLDDSDLDEPDELHVQVDNHADTLSALPEELDE